MTSKEVLGKLRNSKLLTIQDHDGLNRIDQGLYDAPIQDYDLHYPGRLKEYLGVDLIIVRSNELIGEMEKVEEKEAEKIADMWMNEATEVKNVKHHDIVRAAKLVFTVFLILYLYSLRLNGIIEEKVSIISYNTITTGRYTNN